MLPRLLELGLDLEHRDESGCTPLLHACESDNSDMVAALLKAGASAEAADKYGNTALHLAAKSRTWGDSTVMRKLVRECGIPVDVRDIFGCTPLHATAANGCGHNARALLELGASVGARSDAGSTVLHLPGEAVIED